MLHSTYYYMRETTVREYYYWGFLVLVTMFFGTMIHYVPFSLDDLMFRRIYVQVNGGNDQFSFNSLWNFITFYRLDDNSRLANLLSPVFSMFLPKWVFTVLTTVCVVGMYHLACMLVTGGRKNPLMLGGIVLVSFVVLPWRDNILVPDYALNYIWPYFFLFLLLWMLIRSQEQRLSTTLMLIGCLVAIISGLLHEGHGVCLLAGLFVEAATNRFRMSRQWWIIVGVFTVGLIWLISAPGLQGRAYRELGGQSNVSMWRMLPMYMSMPILLAIVTGIKMSRKGGMEWFRCVISKPTFVICFSASLVGLAFPLLFRTMFRYGWAPQLFALIALAVIVYPYMMRLRQTTALVLMTSMSLVACVFMANTVRVQRIFSREYDEALALMAASPYGTIYYDATREDAHRKETLFMTVRGLLDGSWAIRVINQGYATSDRMYSFVPAVFSTINDSEVEHLSGTAHLQRYHGELFMPYDRAFKAIYPRITSTYAENDTLVMKLAGDKLNYTFNDSSKRQINTEMYLFVSQRRDTLVYCTPEEIFDGNDVIRADWGF